MTIFVDKADGVCSECGGQLEITGADDVSLDTDCTECGHSIHVETDYFNDGGITYWPAAMLEFGEDE
jgi:DNA-directed RNA polymerase subunit RPC12/RpoP